MPDTEYQDTGGPAHDLPAVIQGGMGVAVSTWQLARAVSRCGQLGTVSGTALAVVIARRLQQGDPDGSVRRALGHFPIPGVAERVLARYFVEGGIGAGQPYKAVPTPTLTPKAAFTELTVAANFVEVFLAKEGHNGVVGVNYLHKVRIPTPASLYGALLAGVDYVAMGAGIPRDIPAMLNALAAHQPVQVRIPLADGDPASPGVLRFDPAGLWPASRHDALPSLGRPRFLAIVASVVLATALARDPVTRPDGFVVEGPTAGGHNAPPRGKLRLDDDGQPIYGPRDSVDPAAMAKLGLPFWLAGGYDTPERLREAWAQGAAGVQVGTLFALSAESGLADPLKTALLGQTRDGAVRVATSPVASPTGFPFKVAALAGTLSDEAVAAARPRVCDLGFLTDAYQAPGGEIGFRCAAEPVDDYVRKGGDAADTVGRVCLCNALTATAGLPQHRAGGYVEPAVVTAGDGLAQASALLSADRISYTAADVLEHLLGTS